MISSEIRNFQNGLLYINNECIRIDQLEWNEHPVNKGVFLKHIITGKNTDNQLSCHLVKINPGCEIGAHVHDGQTEIHEILVGSGLCVIEGTHVSYERGTIGFIPANKNHLVKADDDGLVLMAKFFPALV